MKPITLSYMTYSDFQGLKLSSLGFGAMRLPQLEDGSVDRETVRQMVDYAIEHGVNYFDTAAPYHAGMSEPILGEALSRHPRDSWYLATKYPGHQHSKSFNPAATFEGQLRRCGVDWFDFYLFHNVCENSLADYMNPEWGMLDYFVEQRRLGRIRHLGMSSHAEPEVLRQILDGPYGKAIEFCQIQLNYLDWDLQKAKEKVAMLNERGIPIWVMEPVRGGKLAKLSESPASALKALRHDASTASWAFRWLQDVPGVKVILSGMSNMEQLADNIRTFESAQPLGAEEKETLAVIAEGLRDSIPCTACRYCCDGCPAGLDIPALIAALNDLKVEVTFNTVMRLEALPEDKLPSACLGCGACTQICPQGIDIPGAMTELAGIFEKAPKWADVCVERNRIAEMQAAAEQSGKA